MLKQKLLKKYSQYRFEISHITIFFTVLIIFQIVVTFIQKSSINDLLVQTQKWYQKDAAERLAIVTTTSLELMAENMLFQKQLVESEERKIISSLNVIFRQQLIQGSVQDISLILTKKHRLYVIDSGQQFNDYLKNTLVPYTPDMIKHKEGVDLFLSKKETMRSQEVIFGTLDGENAVQILVPFVPNGEYLGVLYMKIKPNFSFITTEVTDSLNYVTLLYSGLIFLGLLSIFIVSSQAVKERNEAQEHLYEEHEENIKKEIRLEKESLFTKRIYHTHHKAEKIIGFIKEDVRKIESDDFLKKRIITYSNFISRIMYDMKWYDQPINTIVNPMFRTNINEVTKFILDYVFLRISSKNEMFEFKTGFDEKMPFVPINEFVIWEILEPLIQNSIDHGKKQQITISISTEYDEKTRKSVLTISDTGVGIKPELLEIGDNGIKRIFLENESTKIVTTSGAGYGCYIAYQMAVGKCGWEMDAENLDSGGCRFTMKIAH